MPERQEQKIKLVIVGISEIRILDESITEPLGFLMKSNWKKHVIEIKNFSERLTLLKIKVNINNSTISILQIYAPTSSATSSEIENCYHQLEATKIYMSLPKESW